MALEELGVHPVDAEHDDALADVVGDGSAAVDRQEQGAENRRGRRAPLDDAAHLTRNIHLAKRR